jgi:ribosomal protein L7/L12
MAGIGVLELVIIAVGVLAAVAWVASRTAQRRASAPPLAARLGRSAGPDPAALDELDDGARDVRKTSGDVAAIKYVREQTGWGLLEATTYVDGLT